MKRRMEVMRRIKVMKKRIEVMEKRIEVMEKMEERKGGQREREKLRNLSAEQGEQTANDAEMIAARMTRDKNV